MLEYNVFQLLLTHRIYLLELLLVMNEGLSNRFHGLLDLDNNRETNKDFEKIIQRLKSGPYDQLIMNVQDPVDRFVSAFQSTLEECGPESLDPDQCGERGTDEWSIK